MSRPDRKHCLGIALFVAACGLLLSMAAYAREPLSDPTRPPAAIQPAANAGGEGLARRSLELQAILHAAGRRVAIINGRRVHENETIEAAKVLEISKSRVRMVREGQAIELSLKHERIKKTESSKTQTPSRASAMEGRTE